MIELENPEVASLIADVKIYSIKTNFDCRGSFTEIFRNYWCPQKSFQQWNFLDNNKNMLRGVHIHPIHTDFLIMLTGTLTIGLLDLRRNSPTFNNSCLFEVSAEPRQAIIIPNGVAHGLYSKDKSSCIIAFDFYGCPGDDLGCHWESTKKYIEWPFEKPLLSERDTNAQSLEQLQQHLSNIKP